MSYRGLVTSKISPELFVFMKTKTYVCDINQSLVIMKSITCSLVASNDGKDKRKHESS